MKAVQAVVGAVGELLITLGVLLLLFLAWQLWWTDVEANAAQQESVDRLEQDWNQGKGSGGAGAKADEVPEGDAFALLRVPRLGKDWVRPIVKGSTLEVLNHGIGEYSSSAGPGEVGNFALAGHRISWGRPFYDIENMREGDYLVVETKDKKYVYQWARHRIVYPANSEILAPVPDAPGIKPTEPWMTITTCHPKFSAEQRFIGYAKLVKTLDHSAALPAQYTEVK